MTRTLACTGTLAFALLASSASAQTATPGAAAGPPAAASPTPSASLADALQGPAKTAYDSAILLAQNKDFGTALAEFGHAYSLSKDPRLLFNMAKCEKELHHYARMRVLLEQYLRDGALLATADSQSAARDALAAIKPLVASILIKANEDGADVTVDGEAAGTTPLGSSVPVDLGKHTVAVKKAGFDAFEQSLDTPGGTEATVDVTLKAQQHVAQLTVIADGDATVVIDGKDAGKGRFDGAVAAGSHDVSVTEPGKKPYASQVVLRDGETRSMQVTLEDVSHGGSALPYILGGAAVLVAGAAVGGYFLFKPSDTTTPAPTGTFGNLKLTSWGGR
jgi:hypothetical protein